ncbi:hypothetical protein F5Y10DRAFT_267640 [Nemania abortiva]|nr:hypothetical protein F5Y10DRAFT_267640 [Nemania abortiva]
MPNRPQGLGGSCLSKGTSGGRNQGSGGSGTNTSAGAGSNAGGNTGGGHSSSNTTGGSAPAQGGSSGNEPNSSSGRRFIDRGYDLEPPTDTWGSRFGWKESMAEGEWA